MKIIIGCKARWNQLKDMMSVLCPYIPYLVPDNNSTNSTLPIELYLADKDIGREPEIAVKEQHKNWQRAVKSLEYLTKNIFPEIEVYKRETHPMLQTLRS